MMESSEDPETNEKEEMNEEVEVGEEEEEEEGEVENQDNAPNDEPELVESSSDIGLSDTEDMEDIDKAYVHLSTKTKFGTEQTEKDFDSIDPFDDDLADLKVLLAKPTCFLVLGKPGSGKTSVARKLANFWKCQLITPSDCLEQAIQQNTTLGNKAQQILQRGEIVNDELVIQIIEERLKSPECNHYGYILDGFPCLSEEYMSYSDQMNMLKNLTLKPDVIINLRIPDMDLVNRRSGNKVDPMTNISYPKDKYAPEKGEGKKRGDSLEGEAEEGGEEEEANEEEEEEQTPVEEEDEYTAFDEDSGELEEEVIQRLVTRPEDFPENVSASISSFKDQLLTPIEDLMFDHDPQNLIEINAILNEKTVFRQIMQKLTMLSFRPAIVPMRLHGSEEEELPEDMDTDELFRQMAPVNHPGPRWRWRRSQWGRFCPVSLREGNILWGKPDFGVSFLDKMFFLATEEAMKKFLANPRPFLLPPQPRPPCRFSVMGPPLSGKTTLSYMLAKKYGAYVLDVNKIMKGKFAEARQKAIEDAKMEATEQAITQVKQQIEAAILAAKALERKTRRRRRKNAEEEANAAANATNEEGTEEENNEDTKDDEEEEDESGGDENEAEAVEDSTEKADAAPADSQQANAESAKANEEDSISVQSDPINVIYEANQIKDTLPTKRSNEKTQNVDRLVLEERLVRDPIYSNLDRIEEQSERKTGFDERPSRTQSRTQSRSESRSKGLKVSFKDEVEEQAKLDKKRDNKVDSAKLKTDKFSPKDNENAGFANVASVSALDGDNYAFLESQNLNNESNLLSSGNVSETENEKEIAGLKSGIETKSEDKKGIDLSVSSHNENALNRVDESSQNKESEQIEVPFDSERLSVYSRSNATSASSSVARAGSAEEVNPVDEVDETHAEVIALVEQAVKLAETKELELPAEVYAESILSAIKRVKKKMVKLSPFTPMATAYEVEPLDEIANGGYILDNFPRTRDQWTALQDKGVIVDEVLCIQDNSEGGQYLLKRYYDLNKDEVEEAIRARIEEEKRKQLELEEAARKAAEEEEERRRREEEEQARIQAEEEAARKAALGDFDEEEEATAEETAEESDEAKKKKEEEEEEESEAVDPTSEGDPQTATSETQNATSTEGTTQQGDATGAAAAGQANKEADEAASFLAPPNLSKLHPQLYVEGDYDNLSQDADSEADSKADTTPYDAPEMESFKNRKLDFEREWPQLASTISATCPIEPKVIPVEEGVAKEDVRDVAIKAIEDPFRYKPWEYTGIDMDEEEEDYENDQDGEEEVGEDEEDDELLKKRKRPLGDSQHYCPVELKDRGVLFPGNQEIASKYREKSYYFSSPEAREKFMRSPDTYIAQDRPLKAPPLRMFILGAKGAGKTTHASELSRKLGVFHISFMDRLQEMVIAKTKKRVLRTGEEDEDAEEEPLEDEMEDGNGKEGAGGSGGGGAGGDGGISKAEETEVTGDISGETEEEKDASEELTEDEEAIRAYLADDEPMPPELLGQIITKWWHTEPYKSTGFILEGFPRLQDEVTYLQQVGLYPDCALVLSTEDSDVVDRLLPPRMGKWKVRRDRKLAKKQKQMEKKQKEREEAMTKRRNELLAEREARREERRKQKVDDDDEDEEEDDIEAILAEEFEEEEAEEEEDEEQESDALERIKGEITERFEDENNKMQGVIEALDEFIIPKMEITAGRKVKIVRYLINSRLEKMITCRESIFERVYPVSMALAKRLLNSGHKHPSIFGRWDPVDLLNKKACVQPLQTAASPTYAAVYRQHVYFMSSSENRSLFMDQPRRYVSQPPPKPSIPIQIAIIGPPKSGKTTLANKFASEFGMMRLSIGEAIRTILTNLPKSELARKMNEFLYRGKALPDELAVEALQCQLLDMKCQTRGFILDGYPVTQRQIELLNEQHIVPHKVIQLEVPTDEVLIRGAKDRLSPDSPPLPDRAVLPLHDSHKILSIRLTAWQKEVTGVIEWYQREHDNFHSVDGTMSKWWVGEKSKQIAFESVRATQTYMDRTYQGSAASIKNLCITPTEFQSRLGVFGQYCPVSLALRGEFCDCSTQPNLDLAAEFRGKYYKMATQMELDEFLMNAVMYVPPLAPHSLPPEDELPRRRSQLDVKAMFPKRIELQGYDPVSFLDGKKRYEAIIPGDADNYVVEYRKKLFCFSSEKNLEKFLRLPEKYWNLTLPHKLPPKKQPLSVTGLPMLGYLEQTVASAIIKSLTAVGGNKPKHPFLSATRSALVYVAFHLKANNPSASDFKKKKYKQKLEQFEEKCELIHYLSNNMTVSYREPQHRPIDFDHKMTSFLQLKDTQPSLSLIS
ncbi:adenylate kinase 9-like [Convolutriloba macropyga]|uniref:adenylate kinase 9-like n=1 Tax=Convolutriloba macropyga TaxID=536237 RepID=UPI003F52440D